MGLGKRKDETLVLVFEDEFHEAVKLTVGKENFALAIDNILLQIEGNSLRHTEVLHRFGDINPRLLCNAEEVIYGGTAGKNHCRVVQNFGPLAAKFFQRHTFYAHKGLKVSATLFFATS